MTQRRVDAFLQLAEEEFSAAERLHLPLPRQALYFLQQTVEKLVRAVLEREEIAAGTSHNLMMIAGLLPHEHPLRTKFEAFEHLSSASTRYRYPSGTGVVHPVRASEVSETLAQVDDLKSEVRNFLHQARKR